MTENREMLITPEHLLEFMSKEDYTNFIAKLKARSKHEDYTEITEKDVIWIIAQWSEK